MKQLQRLKWIGIVLIVLIGIALAFMWFLKLDVTIAIATYIVMAILTLVFFHFTGDFLDERDREINQKLDGAAGLALQDAGIGILTYKNNMEIETVSDFFISRNMDHRGENILAWLPELSDVIDGGEEGKVIINDDKYAVYRKSGVNTLIFRDISELYDTQEKLDDNALVLGLLNFDNYEEVAELDDDLSFFNSSIRPLVYEYFRTYNLVYKNLRNNRILLILNDKQFQQLLEDRFSILSQVRKEAKQGDIEMTISMSFARGSEKFSELDEESLSLLELAQTRGGDQAVVRTIGEEAVFYGGSSEAKGKRSKVKVRVYANTLKDLFAKSSNVIICCHQDADADCLGGALALSLMAQNYCEACIITKTGGVEKTIAEVLKENNEELSSRHSFVSENEAINRLKDDSLVIMVDHHSASQSNGSNLLKSAKRIVIIDHHRRKADLDTDPLLAYIEASASSASELCVELSPYMLKRNPLNSTEANILYLGMIIDTNHFRTRTGERTFEAARVLKQLGADPVTVEDWSKEPYQDVKTVSAIVENAELKEGGVAICIMDDHNIYQRSLISQACDSLLRMKEVNAGFVLAMIDEDLMAISARSNGKINVQVIMEKMKGGGHMTGAGVQRAGDDLQGLNAELQKVIKEYLEEV